jgi:glycosyltransferase involved in cell wall biosynthesis
MPLDDDARPSGSTRGLEVEVSVVIPTRDRRLYLSQALRSALAQQGARVEVIVIDDGSLDDTYDYLQRLGDPRVHTIRHSESLGVSVARNEGIEAASAPWVAFLDDDDVWAPQKLAIQLRDARSANALWSRTGIIAFDDALPGAYRPPSSDSASLIDLLRTNFIPTPSSVLAATSLVRRVGGFDPDLSVLADWDLWIRMRTVTAPLLCDMPLVGYRVHVENMQRNRLRDLPREHRHMITKHASLLTAEGVQLGGCEYWSWRANLYKWNGMRARAAFQYARVGFRFRSIGYLVRAVVALLDVRGRRGQARLRKHSRSPDWLEELLRRDVGPDISSCRRLGEWSEGCGRGPSAAR